MSRFCGNCGAPGHDGRSCPDRTVTCPECNVAFKKGEGHHFKRCPERLRTRAYKAGLLAAKAELGGAFPDGEWSMEYDRGWVEAEEEPDLVRVLDIPGYHRPWKLFPTGADDRGEISEGAYQKAVDGKVRA